MRIWIDTQTGTWGDVSGLVIVDLEAVTAQSDDEYSILTMLENSSDSDISEFGVLHGKPVIR